jgi:predicted metal-dependent hydrolase
MAGLRLKDIFGGRTGDRRSVEGEIRRVVLGVACVDYRLVRSRRRSIGMQIDFSGLTVRAPRWVSLREIDATLASRGVWILRSLDEWRARRRDVLPREWKTGAPILYRGRELALALVTAPKREIAADLLNLTVLHPAAEDGSRSPRSSRAGCARRRSASCSRGWPSTRARDARAADREALQRRSEWGSCDQKGVIRLNWRLIQLPPRTRALHRRARGRAPDRAQPFGAVLESGRGALSAVRRGTPGARRLTALLEA